ncbi:ubiquitin-60S ribosomal protein L40 [Tetranychus urticae]|nr:ubiquitin-60S ribosomal protein L40 [Tetranychus urticae]
MQIYVKNLEDKSVAFDVNEEDDVSELMYAIQQQENVPYEDIRLIFGGQLEPGSSLLEYGISDGSTLHLALRLRGGAIEPSLMMLAKKYNIDKMVCRKCYARLHAKATNCRKRKCGHSNNLRPKKKPKQQ